MTTRSGLLMGAARCAVGLGLIAAPNRALGITRREEPTPASILLMRTIGIRDLILGFGAVSAACSGKEDEVRRWLAMGLASDSLDAVAGLASSRSIGPTEAVVAVGSALTFVGLDWWALRSLAS